MMYHILKNVPPIENCWEIWLCWSTELLEDSLDEDKQEIADRKVKTSHTLQTLLLSQSNNSQTIDLSRPPN
jgi:hypothetical protein